MTEYLTLDEALDYIEELCGTIECECIKNDHIEPTEKTELASLIYKIIHAHRGKCKAGHESWLLTREDKVV